MHNTASKSHTFTNPFFVATVVSVEDPTYSYRVKVRLPLVHDALKDEELPWAAKVGSSFMGVKESTDLLHAIPEVGSKVLVLAVANDPNSLVYLGSLYTKQSDTPTDEKYTNTYGIYTQNGEFIGVEKVAKVFHMIWSGDLILDVDGQIKLGTNAVQPAVLGKDLESQLQFMIGVFNSHVHTGNLGMPTSPSNSQMELNEVLSKKVTVE